MAAQSKLLVKNPSEAGVRGESLETHRFTREQIIATVGLVLIIVLGALLRFYQLGAYSIGNTYYAATVKSMLTSWHNFFYATSEPGGSVSVDKPPLGFWFQAISAFFLGVNGFSLALLQALAGVLSIPLLYSMVKRPFGVWAGLIAVLILAIMPVTIATERNNTMDGMLVFVLLLATKRPVLPFGGYSGSDNVISVDQLSQMVASGELRFILARPQLTQRKPEIVNWVIQHCSILILAGMTPPSTATSQIQRPGGMQPPPSTLYDCALD